MLSVVQVDTATKVIRIIKCTINCISYRDSTSWGTRQSCYTLWRLIWNNLGLRIGSLSYFENIRNWLITVLIEFRTFGWCNIRRVLLFVLTSICWLECSIYIRMLLLNLSRLIRIHVNQTSKFVIFCLLLGLLPSLAIYCGLRSSSHNKRILNMIALRLKWGFKTLTRVHWTKHVIFRICSCVSRRAFDRPHMNHVSTNADRPRILIFVAGLIIVILLYIWGLYDSNFLSRISNTWFSLIHRVGTRHNLSCLIFIDLYLLLLHLSLSLKLLCRHLSNFLSSSRLILNLCVIRVLISNERSRLIEHIIAWNIGIVCLLIILKIIGRNLHSNFYFFGAIVFSGSTLSCTNAKIDPLWFRLVLICHLILGSLII